MKQIIHLTRARKVFYALNVNMSLSFDRLAEMGEKFLGANFQVGDVLVCDNEKKDKRKMLQKTKNGYIIHYARMDKGHEFVPLRSHNGRVTKLDQELI